MRLAHSLRPSVLRHRPARPARRESSIASGARTPCPQATGRSHEIEVSDVAVHTWPGSIAGEELYQDLMESLAELADEGPDAVDLIRGCTFARAFQ
jgi:hypothetical protein